MVWHRRSQWPIWVLPQDLCAGDSTRWVGYLAPSNVHAHRLFPVPAAALYSYTGDNADELSFEEGDKISIVDQSDGDWWKAERDGVIFIVPAAYLQIVEGQ